MEKHNVLLSATTLEELAGLPDVVICKDPDGTINAVITDALTIPPQNKNNIVNLSQGVWVRPTADLEGKMALYFGFQKNQHGQAFFSIIN